MVEKYDYLETFGFYALVYLLIFAAYFTYGIANDFGHKTLTTSLYNNAINGFFWWLPTLNGIDSFYTHGCFWDEELKTCDGTKPSNQNTTSLEPTNTSILALRTYNDRVNYSEAIKLLSKQDARLFTNKELDEIMTNDDLYNKYYDYLPAWTSTHISYKAGETKALVWNEGEEPEEIYLPLEDGWYEVDAKYGIPSGKPSDYSNPNARYLWRLQNEDFEGLVVRFYYGFGGRRGVDGGSASRRFGVLGTKIKKEASSPETYVAKFCAIPNCETKGLKIVTANTNENCPNGTMKEYNLTEPTIGIHTFAELYDPATDEFRGDWCKIQANSIK